MRGTPHASASYQLEVTHQADSSIKPSRKPIEHPEVNQEPHPNATGLANMLKTNNKSAPTDQGDLNMTAPQFCMSRLEKRVRHHTTDVSLIARPELDLETGKVTLSDIMEQLKKSLHEGGHRSNKGYYYCPIGRYQTTAWGDRQAQ